MRTCTVCQKQFTTAKPTSAAKYCSESCKQKAKYKRAKIQAFTFACRTCGAEFQAVHGRTQSFCSRECAQQAPQTAHTDKFTPCEIQDRRFSHAMQMAGYALTGPNKEPCTDKPIDATRLIPRRHNQAGYEWWGGE